MKGVRTRSIHSWSMWRNESKFEVRRLAPPGSYGPSVPQGAAHRLQTCATGQEGVT